MQRKVSQLASKLSTKGKVIDPEDEEIENWIDQLPTE